MIIIEAQIKPIFQFGNRYYSSRNPGHVTIHSKYINSGSIFLRKKKINYVEKNWIGTLGNACLMYIRIQMWGKSVQITRYKVTTRCSKAATYDKLLYVQTDGRVFSYCSMELLCDCCNIYRLEVLPNFHKRIRLLCEIYKSWTKFFNQELLITNISDKKRIISLTERINPACLFIS
jgi:hypothetical protein